MAKRNSNKGNTTYIVSKKSTEASATENKKRSNPQRSRKSQNKDLLNNNNNNNSNTTKANDSSYSPFLGAYNNKPNFIISISLGILSLLSFIAFFTQSNAILIKALRSAECLVIGSGVGQVLASLFLALACAVSFTDDIKIRRKRIIGCLFFPFLTVGLIYSIQATNMSFSDFLIFIQDVSNIHNLLNLFTTLMCALFSKWAIIIVTILFMAICILLIWGITYEDFKKNVKNIICGQRSGTRNTNNENTMPIEPTEYTEPINRAEPNLDNSVATAYQHRTKKQNIEDYNITIDENNVKKSRKPSSSDTISVNDVPKRKMIKEKLFSDAKTSTNEANYKNADNNGQVYFNDTVTDKKTQAKKTSSNKSENYKTPDINLLETGEKVDLREAQEEKDRTTKILSETLGSFGINPNITDIIRGPSVARYELKLEQGIKLSKVTNLSGDIALSLGAVSVRIAPVAGKESVIGIEIPNTSSETVPLRYVLDSDEFKKSKSCVSFAVGKDIANKNVIGDIAKMPHLLIAGTTGSGKSVCVNSMIISMLYKSGPEDVKLIMIDPKIVELSNYNGIPHLLIPVVTDPKKAAGSLQWAVFEMMNRYQTFADNGVRDMASFNKAIAENKITDQKKMPNIVIIIDELADLMLVAEKEVEEAICRVAQMGRAAGMHLVIATQRPSSDVITGLMKANIPSRIAFAVASTIESRIILDTAGAEKLVGKGDMLFAPLGKAKRRVQGCLITEDEVNRVIADIKERYKPEYDDNITKQIEENAINNDKHSGRNRASAMNVSTPDLSGNNETEDGKDVLYNNAVDIVLELGAASTSMLQRRLKLGYARAGRIMDQMEEYGVIGPSEGSKPRKVLISKERWEEVKKLQSNGSVSDDQLKMAQKMSKASDNEQLLNADDNQE